MLLLLFLYDKHDSSGKYLSLIRDLDDSEGEDGGERISVEEVDDLFYYWLESVGVEKSKRM